MGKIMDNLIGRVLLYILSLFQVTLALTVCGLYGTDLSAAHKAGVKADGRWVFAEVVGAMSAVTALIYLIPFVRSLAMVTFIWDSLLFFFWLVVFAIFGKLYVHEHVEGNSRIQRMKNAVWVDLVCMILWLISAIVGGVLFWQKRRERTTFTGRGLERA